MSFELQMPATQAEPLAILERKPEMRAATPRAYVRQRMAEAAERLSRSGLMQAHCELANEALQKLTHLCYEADTDGGAANIDRMTYRLLVPAPWGLRKWEAKTLRHILLDRQASYKPNKGLPPLFTFDAAANTWHLNAGDYPTIDHAEAWLKHHPIQLEEWRRYVEQQRDQVASRRREYRRQGK